MELDSLPAIKDKPVGSVEIRTKDGKYIIALVVKRDKSELIEREDLILALQRLYDVVRELDIRTLTFCKDNLDRIPWETIQHYLNDTFRDLNIKLTVCWNETLAPPAEERKNVIKENHCSAIGGHKGVTKTYNRIKRQYSWPNMKTDVQNFVRSCRDCQLKKLVRNKTKQPMILTDTPDTAFDKLSMDIMGPLPPTKANNVYILTAQDLLTKYSVAIPLQRATAVDVANALVDDVICIYGAPKAILTDQGSNFVNSLMKTVAKKFRISRVQTTAYRPQSNGSVERSHHVLWEYLKQYVDRYHEWDQLLKLACYSYNTSVHEGTRYTPYELVFGKIARAPSSDPPPDDCRDESYNNYVVKLFNRLHDSQTIAHTNLNKAKARSKLYYDRKINPRRFQKGDRVYLLKEPNRDKLGDQYVGPYEIIEVLDRNNVKLAISSNKNKTVHIDKIKLAHSDTPTNEDPPPLPQRPNSSELQRPSTSGTGDARTTTCRPEL